MKKVLKMKIILGSALMLLAVGPCVTYRGCTPNGDNDKVIHIEEGDLHRGAAFAVEKMKLLFSSAQDSYFHRNGFKFAGSMKELGEGFSIGAMGTVIHRDIWFCRYPGGDGQNPFSKIEKEAWKQGYRFAVLPIERDDKKSAAAIIAIQRKPLEEAMKGSDIFWKSRNARREHDLDLIPMLIMPVGPIAKDPYDFSIRDWTIYAVESQKDFDCILKEHINDNARALAQKDLNAIIGRSREIKVGYANPRTK